jgi:hypothetical protein
VAPVLAKNQPIWRSRPSKTSVTGRTPPTCQEWAKLRSSFAYARLRRAQPWTLVRACPAVHSFQECWHGKPLH